MSRFTDYKSILDLDMKTWDEHSCGYSPDCSQDIIDWNSYNDDLHAYIIDDVSAVVEYAKDWERYETEDDTNSDYFNRDYDKAHGIERVSFIYVYDKFRVKEQYQAEWGISDDPVVDLPEIMRLSKEWDTETDDLLDKCIWLEMKGE